MTTVLSNEARKGRRADAACRARLAAALWRGVEDENMTEKKHEPDSLLCPSAPAAEGAILLGVLSADGAVDYLPSEMAASSEFIAIARQGRAPEQRFRFSSPCQQCRCKQWTGSACGLPTRLSDLLADQKVSGPLPQCSIRPRCRWFYQSGADACRICPLVVTQDSEG